MPIRRFLCGSCNQIHTGIPDATFRRPDALLDLPPSVRARCVESDDACILVRPAPGLAALAKRAAGGLAVGAAWPWARRWGCRVGPFLLRAVLRIPLLDPGEGDSDSFGFGPWVEVGEAEYVAENGRREGVLLPPFSGSLATELPGYPRSMGLAVRVEPQPRGMRPTLVCTAEGSLLFREQRSGITVARALEILRLGEMEPQWLAPGEGGEGEWSSMEDGGTLGEQGPDGGVVIRDEEYTGGARITLARGDGGGSSITCGVYGLFVHTRFFAEEGAGEREFELMKPPLAVLADTKDSPHAPDAASRFVNEYP